FSNYTECSFRTDGIGTFRGRENAQPFLGSVGILERAEETKLEMLVPAWKVTSVVRAMRGVHPYEEVAYDVVPLENSAPDFGLGIIGTLPNAMTGKQFLSFVKKSLGATMLRVVGDLTAHVKTVAACGGSGAEFIEEAARKGADAYVTGDLKYHAMQDVPPRLLLIDAGHYETERHVLPHLHKKLQHLAKATKSSTHVFVTTQKTNTIAII
ncbi:MAG: Nif3-like dinuclear metal center hexameric protein, partial [Ignavibacteriales bacterium]|nr:Nif3-like dinuclear metal center hexameric protein [Ignavibacteriales bacterium]